MKGADDLRNRGEIAPALNKASDAERGALNSGYWHAYCRAQILIAKLHFDNDGLCENYRNKALEALSTAREHRLTDLLAELLCLRANSILGKEPHKARKLLDEADRAVGDNNRIMGWICLIRAELESFLGNLTLAEEALNRWELLSRDNRKTDSQDFFHIKFRLAAKQGKFRQALDNLNKALKRARGKKRLMSTGWMLKEKARCLAQIGDFHRAALEAEKSRIIFEKTNLERESFDSALLSGHLFFECREAARALGLADYVLSKADPKQYRNEYVDALQLKTRSLQILKRIVEAREFNGRFRELTAHQPQAQIVADIQDAMLYSQSGEFEHAESMMQEGFQRAKNSRAQEGILASIKVHWAQIKIDQAKHREARSLAEAALKSADKLPPKVIKDASEIIKLAEAGAPLTSLFEDLLNSKAPLELAGTAKSKDIHEAHKQLVRPLLDWTDKWPTALQEIYDFWGRGNLARFILNHRGFGEKVFHVTVEATNVNEARKWAGVLCPLVDVLTILWKGPVLSGGMAIVPVHHEYDGPGGWGYAIAAGSNMCSNEDSEDLNWSPAMGWATLLPNDAVRFLFEEARDFFEEGRMILLPALNVGCVDPGHGPMERMFNDVVNASPILSYQGNNDEAIRLSSLPLPYFPDVPLNELATIVKDEGDSLLKTRLALREWARNIKDRDKLETRALARECYERVESALRDIERKFNDLARRLNWAKLDESIHPHVFDAEKFNTRPLNPASAELAALHGELRPKSQNVGQ
ncbi:MAG: hypothetical protein ABSH17_08360 [Syntrophobacteraceae bacterium]